MVRENDADNEAYRAAVVNSQTPQPEALVRRAYKLMVRILVAGFVAVVVFSTGSVGAGIMVGFPAFVAFMAASAVLKLAGV